MLALIVDFFFDEIIDLNLRWRPNEGDLEAMILWVLEKDVNI